MGMFTTIIGEDGQHLQIKCDYDQCETYRVGEKVNQHTAQHAGEGYLLDGVYDAYGDGAHDLKQGTLTEVSYKEWCTLPHYTDCDEVNDEA